MAVPGRWLRRRPAADTSRPEPAASAAAVRSARGSSSRRFYRPSRRRVIQIAAICALAVLSAVYVVDRISVFPPSLSAREVQFSVAKAEVLVDVPSSQLVDQRENLDLRGPPIQAQYYTLLLETDWFRTAIADAVGLHGKEISASGPFTKWDLVPTTVPINASAAQPLPTDKNYRLLIDVDGVNPMISLYGQAPTTRAAVAIVAKARSMMEQFAKERARSFPVNPEYQVVIRSLGPITAGVVDPGARLQLMAFIFALVFVFGLAAVLAIERRRARGAARARPRLVTAPARTDPEAPTESDDWPHTKRLLPWSLAVFVGAIFLMPIESITLPVHLPFGSTPDRVMIVMIAGLWFVSLVLVAGPARPHLRLTRVHFILFAFFGVVCLGIATNGTQLATNLEVGPTVKKLFILASLLTLFVIASSSLRPGEIWSFFQYILVLGVIVAIAAMIEQRSHSNIFYSLWAKVLPVNPPANLDTLDNIGRLSVDGPTVQPLELASLLSMVLPIAIINAINAVTTKRRLLYLLAAAILLGGAVATSRKTSIVAPLIAVIVLTCYRPRQMIRGLLISALPLFVIVHLAAPGQIGTTISELLPGHINAVSTTTQRAARYDAVRPDLMSHLLLGRGFASYDPFKYRILDNQYLGLLIGVGLIGVTLYLSMFGALFGMTHPMIRGPNLRKSSAALAAQASLAIAFISNALFDVLSFSHVSYLFFFIAAMTIGLRARSDAPVPPPVSASVVPERPAPPGGRIARRMPERSHRRAPVPALH